MQISDELLVRLETAINTVMDDAEVDYPIGYHKGMHRVSWDAAEMRRALAAALSLPVQPVAWEPYQIAIRIGAEVRRRNRVGKDDEAGSISPCCELAATILVLEALHDCGILPATTPPVPPTKGPEDDLIAAAQAFVDKLELCHADPEYQSVWMTSHIHRGAYAGPQYTVELDKLKSALLALRSRPASAFPVVGERIKPLEWYPDPGAFPYNTWGAQSSFGRFIIEEVSASDSPAYEARYTPHHLITIKDSLEDAKAAAQADYERRILSALTPSVQP